MLRRVHRESARAIGDQQWLVMQVAVPILAVDSWIAVRYSWGDPMWALELALAAGIVIVSLTVSLSIRSAPLPPSAILLLAASLGVAVHFALVLAGGPQSLLDYNSFAIGLATVVLTIFAFYSPLGWSLLVATPVAAAVVYQALLGDLTLGESGGALNAALAPPLLGHFFGAYLRWSRHRQDEEEKRVQHLASQIHRRQLRAELTDRQLSRARRLVGPWLREVSDGVWDLHDGKTGALARALAVAMRDDLHLPGVLDDVLCERIDRCRARGTDVVLEAVDGEVDQAGPSLRLLDRVLDLSDRVERLQVRLPERGRPNGVLTILPPLDESTLDALLQGVEGWEHRVSHDLFSTTVTLGNVRISQDARPPY